MINELFLKPINNRIIVTLLMDNKNVAGRPYNQVRFGLFNKHLVIPNA